MKYAVKFSLDTDGFTNWDDDQIEDPDITFSIVIYQSIEEAQRAVNQDFREYQTIGFYSNDTVKSCNGRWLVANDMKMYGGTVVAGEGEAYAVSYEVTGDCDYASMIIESVSPASAEDETHMESDLEEGCVEGVYICEASHCDTENNPEVYSELDSDPFLGGLSLEECLENEIYPDFDDDEIDYYNGTLCNLYDKYGIEAVDKHIDSWTEDDIGSLMEHLSQNEDDRNLCLKLAEQNSDILYWICDYYFTYDNRPYYNEELYRLTDLQIKYGYELRNTIVGEFGLDWIEGMDVLLALWQPVLFKKYGLELLEEEMIRLFNTENCYELWDDFDNQTIDYPNFLHDLVPVLNAYIAKGSVDAANVLMKAFKAGKETYFADATRFTVPEGVTEIPEFAFAGCQGLSDIILPEGIKSIGSYAFTDCYALTNINIPDSVTRICEKAFMCTNLKEVRLPDELEEIGSNAFSICNLQKTITIPHTITKINEEAFSGNENLTEVVLHEGLMEIANGAFCGCYGLKKITIPKGTTKIGESAFEECGLIEVNLSEGLKKIGPMAFIYCEELSNIKIPGGVINIGKAAFKGCISLRNVTLPIGVKTIAKDAFDECDALEKIIVPAKKTDYYKKRLPSELWEKIVELDDIKQ